MPDILTVRRFSLRDVADWKDALMDLSGTELANTFYPSYLYNYTYSDGTVNWLPACAEVDSILVNKTLLEENGLSVPTDYEEFVNVCAELEARGIRPFLSNFGADYTCMEVLQGLSIPQLTSQKGREWRQQYESGQTNQLSEEVWLPVFEQMEEFIDCAGVLSSDTKSGLNVFDEYTADRVAMVRGTGDEAARYDVDGRESVLMPYYGASEKENWYLTYPSFQVAASAAAEEDPERRKLILDIMAAMLSEEGQRSISAGQSMISYSKDVNLDLSPALSFIRPYIDSNQLYIRLASAEMFSVSQQIVQKMITGEYPDAETAFDASNEAMGQKNENMPSAAHVDTGYSYAFDPKKGSAASSSIMNTVREELGVELLVGQSVNVAGNIAAGDYMAEELRYLTMGEYIAIFLCRMTGDQLYRYMDYVLTTPDKRGSVVNDSTLYVSSGFAMEIQKTDTGYRLQKLTKDGKELERGEIYSVAVMGSADLMQKEALEVVGVTEYEEADAVYKEVIVNRLLEGKQLVTPTDYITLHE